MFGNGEFSSCAIQIEGIVDDSRLDNRHPDVIPGVINL